MVVWLKRGDWATRSGDMNGLLNELSLSLTGRSPEGVVGWFVLFLMQVYKIKKRAEAQMCIIQQFSLRVVKLFTFQTVKCVFLAKSYQNSDFGVRDAARSRLHIF